MGECEQGQARGRDRGGKLISQVSTQGLQAGGTFLSIHIVEGARFKPESLAIEIAHEPCYGGTGQQSNDGVPRGMPFTVPHFGPAIPLWVRGRC